MSFHRISCSRVALSRAAITTLTLLIAFAEGLFSQFEAKWEKSLALGGEFWEKVNLNI
jgi:hypothetical protein